MPSHIEHTGCYTAVKKKKKEKKKKTSTPEQQRGGSWWLLACVSAGIWSHNSRFPLLAVVKSHMQAAEFEFTADSASVSHHRPLMADSKYLEHAVKAGLMPACRAGGSSWVIPTNLAEHDNGLKKVYHMVGSG